MKNLLKIFTITLMITMFTLSVASAGDQNAEARAKARTDVVNNPVTTSNSNSGGNEMSMNHGDITITFPEQREVSRSISDNRTENIGKGYRGFSNPADIPIVPQGPAYFGNATPGELFQSLKTILIYKDVFKAEEIGLMEKSSNAKLIPTAVLPAPESDEELAAEIKVYISKPDATMNLVGYLTVRSNNQKTVSAKVLANALEEARKMGGTAIHVTAEGVKREMKSFGWGIGASYTRATINNAEDTGGVAAGGLGISGGTAGYVDFPWLQIFVLK